MTKKDADKNKPPADDAPQDLLKDWKDINKNPPHVGPLKKKGAADDSSK